MSFSLTGHRCSQDKFANVSYRVPNKTRSSVKVLLSAMTGGSSFGKNPKTCIALWKYTGTCCQSLICYTFLYIYDMAAKPIDVPLVRVCVIRVHRKIQNVLEIYLDRGALCIRVPKQDRTPLFLQGNALCDHKIFPRSRACVEQCGMWVGMVLGSEFAF